MSIFARIYDKQGWCKISCILSHAYRLHCATGHIHAGTYVTRGKKGVGGGGGLRNGIRVEYSPTYWRKCGQACGGAGSIIIPTLLWLHDSEL